MRRVLKKSLALILALTMVFGAAPLAGLVGLELPSLKDVFAEKAEAATYGVLTYEINDAEVTITDCNTSASGDLIIPSSIEGYPVTSIGCEAFNEQYKITSVEIPNSVTSIGERAFYDCDRLKEIRIPDSVTSIGIAAFGNCTKLESISVDINNQYYSSDEFGVLFNKDKTGLIQYTEGNVRTEYIIPDSVTSIGNYAFGYCTGLTSVTIPDSVTSIGDYAFFDCYNLTGVTIPDSVTSISRGAFTHCTRLRSVTIPDSVTSISIAPFENCTNLESISVDKNNEYYSSDEFGVLFSKDKTKLIQYPIGNTRTEYTILDSVKSIEDYSFYFCTNLKSVTIGNGTSLIGSGAFAYCSNLTHVTIPEGVTSIGMGAFLSCVSLSNVAIPDSVTFIDELAFSFCYSIKSITIPGSIKKIGKEAFENCTSLKNATICNGVISIGELAFLGCSSLTSITLPFGINSIGSNAFSLCESLKDITIPNSVTTIGHYAFHYCYGLTDIIIPSSVTNIGVGAFEGCSNLKNVEISNSVSIIDSYTFKNCTNLSSITIGSSVTSIGGGAFYGCTGLTSVTIPDSVTSIGEYAFKNCTGLKSATIPYNVTSIGDGAFDRCTSLTSITVDYANTTYSSDEHGVLFNKGKAELIKYPIGNERTEYTIPDSVTCIGEDAFYGCEGLTSITIPNGVTSISNYAFGYCTGLTSITISNSVTSISGGAFTHCTGLKSIEIPDSVTSIGWGAFDDCTSLTDVYFVGTEEQWNTLSVGSNNSCLTNANIHYNSNSGGENPVNPEIYADESESPADRTAYQGVFEDYVTAVVINGNGNWISDIIVDGNKYHIKKDLISFSEADACLNKDVIFIVKDGEVVYFSKAEDITVKTVLGLSGDNTLNYGYLGDNSFSKNSIKLCLRIHNSIVAPDPADFVNSEEQKKNLAAIGKLDNLKVYISNVTLSSDPENIFNFSGKKSVQIPVDRYLSAGGTLTTEVPVNVNSKYKPNEYKYYAYIAGKLAFKKGEVSDTSESNLYITVCNYNLDPNKPTKSNSTTSDENNQLAKKAASELNKVQSGSNQGAISLMGSPDLVELIGFNNIKAIEEKFFAIICLTHIPKEKIQETLSDEVISNVFGVKKWFCLNTNEIQLEVAVNTKYGEIILKLTSEYPENNFNGYNLGGLGRVEYELSGKGAKKLPKDFPKTGFAGFFASVDVTAFCNAAYSFVESELKKSYKLAYGNDVNKAVDFIFGKSVNKILKFTKYGSVSGLTWEALTVAGEEYKIECPVDVFVYDSAGNLVASIENNIETLSCENVEIEINGDTKYVRLFDGSYKIVYKATANGSMRVTVNEMANLDTSLRTVVIDDVPLSAGVSYSQNADGKILEESDYALTANDGTVYNPDSDTVNFHDHISNGVWYDGDSSTCTEKGWKCSICTVCNVWFKEYFDLAKHSDNDGNGYCDDCGAITAVSSFAIRKPSTTTINYGDAIILHADITDDLPTGARIEWTADNGNFSMSVSTDGTTCKISPKSNGKTVFTATVYDKDGNVISSDTQEMTAKAGLWQKIVAFFKKIFGLTKTFPEAFKGIL